MFGPGVITIPSATNANVIKLAYVGIRITSSKQITAKFSEVMKEIFGRDVFIGSEAANESTLGSVRLNANKLTTPVIRRGKTYSTTSRCSIIRNANMLETECCRQSNLKLSKK